MVSQVMEFAEKLLADAKKSGSLEECDTLFDQAFGALRFVLETHPEHDVELGEWWDNEMSSKFWELKWEIVNGNL